MAATNLGTLIVELLLKDGQFKSGLQSSTDKMSSASGIMGGAAQKMANITASAMKAAAASMAAFASASVVVGSNFEKQMAMVGALKGLDQTDQKFQQLEEHARFLGSTTEFTATQAGEALESLARAGESVGDAIKMSSSALVLAGTSATTLDNATQLLVSTQRQFGLGAEETERVTNIMSQAMRSSLLDFTSLREGMKYAGATGHGFKMSLEETTAALAKFRDLGMEGSLAGTQFRSAMSFAGAETLKQTKVLKKYGLTTKDINPETHTFAQILKTVGEAGLTTTDSMKVFGRIAGGSMAQLARGAADGTLEMEALIKKLEESSDAGNTAEDMYSAIANTVRFQAQIAVSALQELMITFFDLFKGPLQDFIKKIPITLNTLSEAFQDNSYEIKRQFKEVFGSMSLFLEGNAKDWGTFLVNLTKVTLTLTAAMMPMIDVLSFWAQHLDKIAGLMGVAFGVQTLIGFVHVVGTLTAAMGMASSSVVVFGTTLTVTSGGLFAAVAGFGLLVTAIWKYINVVGKAKDETEKLGEAQARIKVQNDKQYAAELQRVRSRLAHVKLLARAELATTGLTRAEEARWKATLKLTAADATQKIMTGELIEAFGALYTVSQLINETGIGASAIIEKRVKSYENEAKELRTTREELEYYHRQIETVSDQTSKKFLIEHEFKEKHRRSDLNSEQAYVAEIANLREKENALLKKSGGLRDQLASATADANRKATNSTKQTNTAQVASTGQAVDKMIAHRERLEKSIAKLREKTHNDYMEATLDEKAFFRFQAKEQLNDINTAYAEYRGAHEGNEAKQREIDIEAAAVKLEFIKTMGIKYKELQVENEEETVDEVYDINKKALEKLRDLRGEDLKESEKLERERAQTMAGIAEADAATRLAVWHEYQDKIDAAKAQEKIDSISWESLKQKLGEFAKKVFPKLMESMAIVGKVIGMASEALGAAMSAVKGVFGAVSQWTGFSFDPMSLAQDLSDAKAKAEEEGLDFDLEKQARKMVRGMVNDAVLFVEALVESLPFLLDALVNQLPKLFEAIVAAIPEIVVALIEAIPKIVTLLIQYLPEIALALITGIIKLLPVLVAQSIKLFFTLFFIELPKLIVELLKGLINGLSEWFSNLFKIDPEKKAERKADREERKAERKAARQAAFSGMDFVPATMKMTVHKGEAIIPADRNAQRQSGGPHTAGYAQAFGSSGRSQSAAPIEIAVVAEGRLLDAVQIKAADRGHATGMKKAIRRASGAKVGFQRGRFNAWS